VMTERSCAGRGGVTQLVAREVFARKRTRRKRPSQATNEQEAKVPGGTRGRGGGGNPATVLGGSSRRGKREEPVKPLKRKKPTGCLRQNFPKVRPRQDQRQGESDVYPEKKNEKGKKYDHLHKGTRTRLKIRLTWERKSCRKDARRNS